ncbi:hypothetical protein EP331_14120 [bacterium]|nr:MAG: hypothetical protein EP331_14120 [bacterium]
MNKLIITIIVVLIAFTSCVTYDEVYTDDVLTIQLGDSLYFKHQRNESDSEGGSSSSTSVSVFEDPTFGLYIKNKEPLLQIKPISNGVSLLIPKKTGETHVVVKTRSSTSCVSCFYGDVVTYNYTAVVVLPNK